MSNSSDVYKKIMGLDRLKSWVDDCKSNGQSIVFTNGCFDLLHYGHLEILEKSASFGDKLIVGLNSDYSVKRLKGSQRPINNENFRARMMAAMEWVDAVCIFNEDTPELIINKIIPDVLVKGGDYRIDQIVGAKTVLEHNGKVMIIPIVEGYSTTATIKSLKSEK